MKRSILMVALLSAVVVCGENLLTNSSFENSLPMKKKRWTVELFKEWRCMLNSGAAQGDIQLTTPGFKSKQALRVRTIGKSGFNAVTYAKDFPVTQGQKVTATVMLKGKGTGYIRIYYLDKNGKRLPKYTMQGTHARSEFAQLVVRFTVPAGVEKIRYSLETLRNNADIIPHPYTAPEDTVPDDSIFIAHYELVHLTVFPNPTTESIQITSDAQGGSIEIINAFGQVIYREEHPTYPMTLSLANRAKGTYFIRITDAKKQVVVSKVVKM